MEQRIRRGSTTTLVSYPRLRPDALLVGVPSAANVLVRTPSTASPTMGAAQRDTLTATVAADAREGDTELAVSAAAWVRGRRYLLTAGDDVIDVEGVTNGTATTLKLAQPLPIDVDVGATIAGFAVLRALTAPETANVGECSAQWRAVVGGVDVDWSQLFRIVQRVPTALLTPTRLTRAYPVLQSMAPPTDVPLEGVIGEAWEHVIIPICEAKGVFDEDIVSDEALVPLHALAVMLQLYAFDPRTDAAFVDRLTARFEECEATTFARRGYAEQAHNEQVAPRQPDVDEGRGRLRMRP